MSLPPPIPPPVRSGKRIPGWTWPIIVGAPLVLVGFALIANVNWLRPMTTWRPVMGVPLTQPGEQLSMSPDGAFVYRNKQTGAERTVRNEPEPVTEPAWLHVPSDAERLSAGGKRGGGRRRAMFEYLMPGAWGDGRPTPVDVIGLPLMDDGLVFKRESGKGVIQGFAADRTREIHVYARPKQKMWHVTVQITEPDRP